MTNSTDDHPIEEGHARIMKARVVRRQMVTPHMVELTLQSPDFAVMPNLGPDAFVYVFVPHPGEAAPEVDYDFTWEAWRARPVAERQVGRYYTVRRFRPAAGEIDLHMVLHGEGPLTSWAMDAGPGDAVALWGPRAGFRMASAAGKWVLLAADDAGVPAAAGILESLPADAHGVALLEVRDEEARQPLTAPANIEVRWLPRNGCTAGGRLLEAVRSMAMPADGVYAWAAAETATTVAVREHLKKGRGIPGRDVCAIGYWTMVKEEVGVA